MEERLLLSFETCCDRGSELGVKCCSKCAETSDLYQEAMSLPVRVCEFCGRKFIALNVPDRTRCDFWCDLAWQEEKNGVSLRESIMLGIRCGGLEVPTRRVKDVFALAELKYLVAELMAEGEP